MKIEEVIQTLKSEFCQTDEEILLFITAGVEVMQKTHNQLVKRGCVISKLLDDEMSDLFKSMMKYLDYNVEEVKKCIQA